MEALTYRQMADEIKAVGWEKTDSLEKGRRLKRTPEMLALIEYRITTLREIWSFLDGLAKSEEGGEKLVDPVQKKAPPPSPASPPPEDDDF